MKRIEGCFMKTIGRVSMLIIAVFLHPNIHSMTDDDQPATAFCNHENARTEVQGTLITTMVVYRWHWPIPHQGIPTESVTHAHNASHVDMQDVVPQNPKKRPNLGPLRRTKLTIKHHGNN